MEARDIILVKSSDGFSFFLLPFRWIPKRLLFASLFVELASMLDRPVDVRPSIGFDVTPACKLSREGILLAVLIDAGFELTLVLLFGWKSRK